MTKRVLQYVVLDLEGTTSGDELVVEAQFGLFCHSKESVVVAVFLGEDKAESIPRRWVKTAVLSLGKNLVSKFCRISTMVQLPNSPRGKAVIR